MKTTTRNDARRLPRQIAKTDHALSERRLSSRGGVATISSNRNFLKKGGAIQLFVNKKNASFEINPRALKRADVRISSKLMRVGMKVNVSAN